ncbi:MAG TPA: response regulator [Thermoanaerobaculia bacterium]|nr:response regulator [Thermoanaerobaculia bacterium]
MKFLALVIENDAGTRKLLNVLLSRVGMDVDLVPTGNDALLVLQHVQYDVVVIDLLLPGKSGMELLEWVAEHRPHLLSRSLVLSSAAPAQLDMVRTRWPEVTVIRKPFELGEVLQVTQEMAAQSKMREQTAVEKFCRHSIRAGAKAGLVVTNASVREPVLSFGYTKEMLDAFFPIPSDAPYPLVAAMRHGKPVWLASLQAAAPDYPMLAPVWEKNESRAIAVVPLRENGRIIGAVGWSFREPRLFSEAEQQVFMDIAHALVEWIDGHGGQSAGAAHA